MAKLEWRWTVPSGETVSATLERGIESVSLGARLVSRSSATGNLNGHSFDLGGKSVRVVFDRTAQKCALTVAGAEIAPILAPAAVVLTQVSVDATPTKARFSAQQIAGAAAAVVAAIYLGVIGFHSPGAAWDRLMGSNSPFGDSHSSADKTISARYPNDFSVAQAGDGWLLLTRVGARDEFVACKMIWDEPDAGGEASDPVALVAEKAAGGKYEPRSSTTATCHGGEIATRAEGIVEKDGEQTKVVSCAFEKYGFKYVVAYGVAENRAYADEPLVERIAGAVTVTDPRQVPFFGLGRGVFGLRRR